MRGHQLVTPEGAEAWRAFHEIQRKVLFEARGQFGVYDPSLLDDKRPNHHVKLLVHDDEPIGVVRIDIEGGTAILRRVAIRADVQRRSHGRALLVLAEQFAKEQGCRRILSHVATDAVGFYEKCGFAFDTREPESVLMSKTIQQA
jgi:GNAT superfamily N-acetyltransferase